MVPTHQKLRFIIKFSIATNHEGIEREYFLKCVWVPKINAQVWFMISLLLHNDHPSTQN